MRPGSVDEWLDESAFGLIHFLGYTVTHTTSDGFYSRSFQRDETLDILEEFIDPSSVRYEAAMSSNGYYEPGGVIPTTIKCHVNAMIMIGGEWREVREGDVGIRNYTETPTPKSTQDYDVVYSPVIILYRRNKVGKSYNPVDSYMVLTKAERQKNNSYDLTFQTELCVLDGKELDVSAYNGLSFSTVLQRAFREAGFPAWTFSNCYPGTVQNASGTMTPRQIISYIAQLSGCYIRMRDGLPSLIPVLSVEKTSGGYPTPHWTISSDWVFDDRNVGYGIGKNSVTSVRVYTKDDPKSKFKSVEIYVCSGNPFVQSGNKSVIATYIDDNISVLTTNTGIEIECLFNPKLEPGDFLKCGNHTFLLTRIEWDGGAFCKLNGSKPNTGYI